jgi:subtilisin-like proprotein convertase family protein
MKKPLLVGTIFAAALAAQATVYVTGWTNGVSSFANGGLIPDNNPNGWADARTVSTMPSGSLAGLAVDLNLSSGWTGDLYAYLVNGSGFAVLLDRVGTPMPALGYGAGTLNVTLANNGFNGGGPWTSIHNYGGGSVSGTWNPDNLNSPANGLDSFLGSSPNGTWTLFVADLNGGGLTTVNSWGLQMDIVAVPEVETWVAAALAGVFGALWLNRQVMASAKKS